VLAHNTGLNDSIPLGLSGKSRTMKPRPARQSVRFPAGASVAQAFGHDAAGGGAKNNSQHA